MINVNSALQLLVTGSPANGGIIIIPEHFKAAALAAAEKVRRGLCKKIDESDELLFILSDKYLVVIKCYGKLWSVCFRTVLLEVKHTGTSQACVSDLVPQIYHNLYKLVLDT